VRRSSDNVEQNFTAAQVTDGTLTTFTGANDGYVTVWYDQSGNSNNASQTAAANQPKLVSSGVVELSNNKPSLRFKEDTSRRYLNQPLRDQLSSSFSVLSVVQGETASAMYEGILATNTMMQLARVDGGNWGTYPNGITNTNLYTSTINLITMISSNGNAGDFYTNSNSDGSFTNTAGQSRRAVGGEGTQEFNGYISEMIIYPSDQSANRTGIETNINNEYDIYENQGLLADYPGASAAYSLRNLIDTTTNVVRVRRSSDNTEQDFTATQITDGTLTVFTGANDGYVTIWYDQSDNSNNASQTAAANQPKLVSSGVVELDNGKPCLNYDNTGNDSFDLATNLTNVHSVFQVWNAEQNFGANTQFILGSNNRYDYHAGVSATSFILSSNASGSVKGGANYINSVAKNFLEFPKPLTQCLVSMISLQSDGQVNQLTKDRTISGRSWRGKMQEIILYSTDQTSNKAGIETNINNEYTIY
jgi:hypothetical protein